MRLTLLVIGLCGWLVSPLAQSFQEAKLPEIVTRPTNSMDVRIVDLENDGDLDLVIAVEFYKNIILKNDGRGRFTDASSLIPDKKPILESKPWRYYPYHDSEDVAVADFNKDGFLDLFFVTEDDGFNEYYLGSETGQFTDHSDHIPVKGITNAVISADLDGDGWEDLLLGNNGQNVFLRNVEGELRDETEDRLPQLEDVTQDIEAADVDGDGDLDILVGNEDDNRLLINDGNGYFRDAPSTVLSTGIGEETREADFADVDGDGDLDIYFANVKMFTEKSPIQRLLINEEGVYQDHSTTLLELSPTAGVVDADFYDLDGDGDLDLLLGKMDGFSIALNDGRGKFVELSDPLLSAIGGLVVDVEVADFNGDGKPDIYLGCFRGPDRLLMGE